MVKHRDNVSGLLLLDKPKGLSSNQALQDVKYLLNAKKAGHTGSLDPLATGLLPLCFGEATKLSSYLLDADKSYQAVFKLGQATDTYDSEGTITQTHPITVSTKQIGDAMATFVGIIDQVPPMFSALKKDGKPLYELARQGIEVERQPRRLQLHQFDLINHKNDTIEVSVNCSSGFYVRSLANDLGDLLGCGAHVTELRRTASGHLNLDRAVSIDQLRAITVTESRQALLEPADQVLNHLQAIELNKEQATRLFQGQAIMQNGLPSNGLVRLYLQPGNQFIGVGLVVLGNSIKPKRLINPQSINL